VQQRQQQNLPLQQHYSPQHLLLNCQLQLNPQQRLNQICTCNSINNCT
jgi:hypothetical protein